GRGDRRPGGGGGRQAEPLSQAAAADRPAPVQGAQRRRAVRVEGQAVPPGGAPLRAEGGQLPGLPPGGVGEGEVAGAWTSQVTYLVSTEPSPCCPRPLREHQWGHQGIRGRENLKKHEGFSSF